MKKKLFLMLLTCVMALGMSSLLTKANAATLLDETYEDEFANGIDEEKYTVIGDADEKYTFVEKPGQLKITNFNYTDGLVRIKNPVDIPDGASLVVQWEIVKDEVAAGGYVTYIKGAADMGAGWADGIHHCRVGALLFGTAAFANNLSGVETQWHDTTVLAENALTRHVYNADGSAQIYGASGNDASTLAKLLEFVAGKLKDTGDGYFGFMGNGMNGSYTIDNFKIGYASDETCSDITWLLEDDFETSDNWTIEAGADRTQIGAAKYLVADNPANGAAIVYNEAFAKTEGVNKLFETSLSLDVTSMEAGKAIGLAAGLAADATSAAGAPFVGVREKEDGSAELVLIANGEVAQAADLGASLDGAEALLNVSASINEEGKVVLAGSVGSVSVSHVLDSLDGHIAIATVGAEGSVVAKIKKLSVNSYKEVVEQGRSLSTDFSEPLNKNWELVSAPSPETNGYVAVEEGKLEFELAGDGAFFGPKYRYVNFDVKFDVKVQLLDEDDEGNVIKPSTWVGLSFGKETIDEGFGTNKLIYFQATTLDLLNFAGNARTWVVGDQDIFDAENGTYTIRVKALDGTVSIYVTNLDAETPTETKIAEYHNIDTAGYLGICCTAGGNFTIDNFSIVNLDGNELTNAAPVVTTEKTSHVVNLGSTLTGSVTATDADNDALVYTLVADNTSEYGQLTFNNDGTYTFVASAAVASTTFTYTVTDTEDTSEVQTITIKVNALPQLSAATSEASVKAGESVSGSVTATDAENDTLTYALVADNTSASGQLTFNADGTWTFVAKADAAVGEVTFTYKANDGLGDSAEGTVKISVAAQPVVEEPTPEESNGCGGAIVASIGAVATLCGAVLVLRKRKENE